MRSAEEWADAGPDYMTLSYRMQLIRAIQRDAIEAAAKVYEKSETFSHWGRASGGTSLAYAARSIRALLPKETK